MKPTDEMIEAGRMVLVDKTGHGYGPDLVRAVYDAMRGAEAPAIVPDELVKAVEVYLTWRDEGRMNALHEADPIQRFRRRNAEYEDMRKMLGTALAIPRRTEADIRADERERLAKLCGVGLVVGCCDNGGVSFFQDLPDWLRSQGGE